jgi:hypothetical protein
MLFAVDVRSLERNMKSRMDVHDLKKKESRPVKRPVFQDDGDRMEILWSPSISRALFDPVWEKGKS